MDSIVQYDTPLVRFKKELWNLCLSMKVFAHIPENKVENAKQIFDQIVRVASGHRTKSEKLGFGGSEFVPWQIGAVM